MTKTQSPAWQFAVPPDRDGVQALIAWVLNMDQDVALAQKMIAEKHASLPGPPT